MAKSTDFYVRAEPELRAEVERAAEHYGVSRSDFIRKVLTAFFKLQNKEAVLQADIERRLA